MSFLNPFLLSGLALISVPIIIYLLHRRKVRKLEWAAMKFLLEIAKEQQKRLQLEEWLLLLFRILMLLFFVLALARPVLMPKGGLGFLGGSGEILIAIDTSFSMGTRQGPRDRLDAGKKQSLSIFQQLPSNYRVSLMQLNENPQLVVGSFSGDHELMKETVKTIKLTDLGGDPERNIGFIRTFLKEHAKDPNRVVFVISDFQRHEWGSPRQELLDELKQLCETTKIIFVPVGDHYHQNATAVGIELLQGAVRAGQTAYFVGKILNHSSEEMVDVGVDILLDGEVIDTRSITLQPGQVHKLYFSYDIPDVGIHKVMLRILKDVNPLDNTAYLSFYAYDKLKVLAVFEPNTEGFSSVRPTDFIEICLNPYKDRSNDPRALYLFQHIHPQELVGEDLKDYELVVVTNVTAFTESEVQQLATFLKEGGGILLFLGPNSKPELYNEKFYQENDQGIFPWPLLSEPLGTVEGKKPLLVQITSPEHPLWEHLVTPQRNYMANVKFYRAYGFIPSPSKRGIPLAIMRTGAEEGEDKQVILISEIQYGKGHLLVIGSSSDLSWNNFAARPAFVAFMQQVVQRLRNPQRHSMGFLTGRPITIERSWKDARDIYEWIDPLQNKTQHPVLQEGDHYYLNLGIPSVAGFYQLRHSVDRNRLEEIAVNRPVAEGNVETLNPDELRKLYESSGVLVDETENLQKTFQQLKSSADLSTIFLILALLFWIGENLLGHRIARRQL